MVVHRYQTVVRNTTEEDVFVCDNQHFKQKKKTIICCISKGRMRQQKNARDLNEIRVIISQNVDRVDEMMKIVFLSGVSSEWDQ